jgi:DNA-binding PadR family transcriptional regulator
MRKRRNVGAPVGQAEVEALLPIRPAAFAVLAALGDAPRPGFEILERVNASVRSRPLLGPGTLYRLMRELRRDGWIERTTVPRGADGGEDERRQYHALTPLGRQILKAEATRLQRAMAMAGLLDDPHGAAG